MSRLSEPVGSLPREHGFKERLASGDAYVERWWNESDAAALESAVVDYRAALGESGLDDWELRIKTQISLSDALRSQFEEGLGSQEDDEELFREALHLAEKSVADAPTASSLHLEALRARGQVFFRRYHSKEHTQAASDTFRDLIELASERHSDILILALAMYAEVLIVLSDGQKNATELVKLANDAVDRALALLPEGKETPSHLVLAQTWSRLVRGRLTKSMNDLQEAINASEDLLPRLPPNHYSRQMHYQNLRHAYFTRYQLSGASEDLDQSIIYSSELLKRRPPSHPAWFSAQANHASALYFRFIARGDLRDLEEAIDTCRAAVLHVQAAPKGRRPFLSRMVSNLAELLILRYSQTGNLDLLDEAIRLQWENLKELPASGRASALDTIANAYRHRFVTQGRLSDLSTAIQMLDQALECAEPGYEQAMVTYNLADAMLALWEETKDVTKLHKAISLLTTSLSSDFPQPQERGRQQSLLGLALLRRGTLTSSAADVHESMHLQRQALELLSDQDPRQQVCYFRLGLAEYQTFVIERRRVGIDHSIAAFNRALSIMPLDHPDRASYLSNLSKSLLSLYDLEGSSDALAEAWKTLREAIAHTTSWLTDRYEAAVQLASAFHRRGYLVDAMEAYSAAIALLPELASFGLEDELRIKHIGKQAQEIPQDAAACALDMGNPELAVELLEAGRAILWNAGQGLRVDLARLTEVVPDIASELAQTNAALEFRPQTEKSLSSAEADAERRRFNRLVLRRTELIAEIRSYPEFQHFLLPATYSSLKLAALGGPVVILYSSAYRSDALVIRADTDITIVPLRHIRDDQVKSEAGTLQYWLAFAARDRKGLQFLDAALQRLLHWLWQNIGVPVCLALGEYVTVREPPRLWWCPVGPFSFLPIHACGPYQGSGPGMPDLVVSSYTPTLSALLKARGDDSATFAPKFPASVLVISLPHAPGHAPLPAATAETEVLHDLYKDSATYLVGAAATLSAVQSHLQTDCSWLHMVSHGTQSFRNPLQSAIALYDSPLTLSVLSQTRLPHAEFAFLSACHSAKGTPWLADESMHLAAGMMFAGFKSVVATSWAIADKDGPEVTREFYNHITQAGSTPRATDAAEALHKAVRKLRESGVSAARWVPFIHLGA